jgi:hypothetical protein
MMTQKQMLDILLSACKGYIDSIMSGYGKVDKELSGFEEKYMGSYSGGAPIDHVLFRKFLRMFDPTTKQDKIDQGLETDSKDVVGAINELLGKLGSVSGGTSSKEIEEVDSESDLYLIADPQSEVIYITKDNNGLFIWDDKNSEFVRVNGKAVDSTIYVTNLDDLLSYQHTKGGIFTVVVASGGESKTSTSYSLIVSSMVVGSVVTYTSILSSKDGWAEEKIKDGKKVWVWHKYAYEEDILKLIYAGL